MEIWKTLIGPVLVALIVGYLLKDIQQPPVAAVYAEANWIDGQNPFSAINLQKSLESTKHDKRAIEKFTTVAEEYIVLRMASIKLQNTSRLVSKPIEVSIPEGGVLVWFDENKNPKIDLRRNIESLPPSGQLDLTALLRPTLGEADPGVLVTHNGHAVDLHVLRADAESKWIINLSNSSPFLFLVITFLAPILAAAFLLGVVAAYYVHSSYDRRARFTGSTEAKDLAKFLSHLRKNYPEKLK